jgi:hypothetical protein
MIYVNPPFRIYGPPLSLFGGVEIQPPFASSKLIMDVQKILSDLGDSLYQAYEIKSRIDVKQNLLLYRSSPVIATIDRKCRDYHISDMDVAERIQKMVLEKGKESALMFHNKGFYLLHILQEKLAPETTEKLVKATTVSIFNIVGRAYRISSTIKSNMLKIDAEVVPPTFDGIV